MSTSQPEAENELSQKEKSHLVGDMKPMLNGFTESSQASSNGDEGPKENGDVNHKVSSKSSHKPSDGHHVSSSKSGSSSDREKHSSSSSKHSSSTKHGSSSSSSKEKSSSSSSSSRPKEGHSSSSSSSKHKEGSSSKHSSSGSSSKSKELGSSSDSRADKDKSNSSSSKPKDSSSSSSNKHVSSSSDKHKESSSKHREGGSSGSSSKHSSNSKPKDSSDKDKSGNSSSNKIKDNNREKSSSRSEKHSSSSDKPKSSSLSSSPSKRHEGEKKVSNEAEKQKSSTKSDSGSGKEKHSSSQNKEEIKIKKEADAEAAPSTNGDCKPPIQMDMALKLEDCVKGHSPKKSPVKLERMEVDDDQSEDDDDEKPLSLRKKETKPTKRPHESSDYEDEEEERHDDDDEEDEDSDVPLSIRNKKKQKLDKKPVKKEIKKEVKKENKKGVKKEIKKETPTSKAKKREHQEETSDEPNKKKKKEEEQEVWRWWEEKGEDNGIKWTFLEHKGPVFAAPYEPLPSNVRFYYDGKPMQLSPAAEEVASFYGRMLDHEYTSRDVFNKNFMSDWRKLMTAEEKAKITNLKLCNFTEINDHFKRRTEERKNRSKEEKQQLKKENEAIIKEYGYCDIDHHKERIGNFRIEPPDLFRGRGDHPKMGCIKKRINPEDVIINCSKDSIAPKAPAGHKWKEVRHDNTVTWLACWTANVLGSTKYVMLNAASKLKGQKDWQKYEVARKLHGCVDGIRARYRDDWKSKEMRVRQRAVALYFIDKLALRAGNEKEEGETADTVGCCSLRVEHIKLHQEKDGKQHVVEFDFLGKDSIRYYNAIPVEKRVFKNLELFMENKQPEDDLFDRLNTTILNKYLQELMEGLTAKVFRTFNASKTLSEQLELLTNGDDSVAAKLLSYNRANRAVAILCNHQRSVPKTFEKSMENLQKKIDSKKNEIRQVKKEIKEIKADYKREKSVKTKTLYDKKKNTQKRLEEQLNRLEVQATDRDENKEIALGTSKLNYLDPRISVAWCKKFGVPIEKVYNKTQRDKFRWAIDMTNEHFKF